MYERKTNEAPRRRGRPSKYKKEMIEQVFEFSLLGLTNQAIADFFGITLTVYDSWMVYNEEFADARNRGRDAADAKVARSLYKKALGFSYDETYEQYNADGELIRTEITHKTVVPDTQACLKWLALRQRDKWADVSKSEHTVRYSGEVDLNVVSEQLRNRDEYTDEDLDLALKIGLQGLEFPVHGQKN